MAEGWKYHVVNICSNITLKYMFARPSAVTLTNKTLGHNELQYEIWEDIMNINVDAAQSQRERSVIVETESLVSAVPCYQKLEFR